MKRLALIFGLSAFIGCAPSIYYNAPDHSLADCQKAYQECKYEAMKATSSVSSPMFRDQVLMDVELKRKAGELIGQCMKIKGYEYVSQPTSTSCRHE